MKSFAFLLPLPWLFMLPGCLSPDSETSITITGSTTVAPIVADAARRFEEAHPGVRIHVQTGGSSRGISDALNGMADLGMASRSLKPAESRLSGHRIAIDGVCLIAHRTNPVSGLTRDEVIAIFEKRITNWKELGGEDAAIVVMNKAEGRGTLEVFLRYTGLDSSRIRADVIVGENQQAIKAVAGNVNAIGYVSIGAAASEAAAGTPVRLLQSDGIAPTPASVASGDFPVTRPLLVVSRGEPEGLAGEFLDYLKSPAVDDIIQSHRYVPVAHP